MRLKTMENVDEGKNKKHTGKLTDNPKDRTPYILLVIERCDGHRRAAVLNLSERVQNKNIV